MAIYLIIRKDKEEHPIWRPQFIIGSLINAKKDTPNHRDRASLELLQSCKSTQRQVTQ